MRLDGSKRLVLEKDYEISGSSGINGKLKRVTAEGLAPYYYGSADISIGALAKRAILYGIKNTKKGLKLYWKKQSGALGYIIYRKTGNGKLQMIKKIEDFKTVTWLDESKIKNKKKTVYYLKAYTINTDGKNVYTKVSKPKGLLEETKISLAEYESYRLLLKFKKVKYAEYYQIQYSGKKKKLKHGKKEYVYSNDIWGYINVGRDCYVRVRPCFRYESGKKTQYIYGEWSSIKKCK